MSIGDILVSLRLGTHLALTYTPNSHTVTNMSDRQLSTTASLEAHPLHYYEDGNFILVVKNIKFRLWRSLLAQKSEVMKDMLDVPQASHNTLPTCNAAQEMVDGVPAVTLMDDLEVFTLLLDVLLPQTTRPTTLKESIIIYPLLDKYAFETLREHVMADILGKLPSTIEDFNDDCRLQIYDDLVLAAQVIKGARQMNITKLVPLAFYALATKDWGKNLGMADQAIQLLSGEDQVRLQSGRVALQNTAFTMNQIYLQDQQSCSTTQASKFRRGVVGDIAGTTQSSTCKGSMMTKEALVSLLKDPLCELASQISLPRSSLCAKCAKDIVDGLKDAYYNLFNQMEQIFRL